MRSAADRLADQVLDPGAVAVAEVARPALRLLQQFPELGLLALGQVASSRSRPLFASHRLATQTFAQGTRFQRWGAALRASQKGIRPPGYSTTSTVPCIVGWI